MEVAIVDPMSDEAQRCLARYFAEIDDRFAAGFDAAAGLPTPPEAMRPPQGVFLVVRIDGEVRLVVHAAESVRPTEDKRANQPLDRPALVHELGGQVV